MLLFHWLDQLMFLSKWKAIVLNTCSSHLHERALSSWFRSYDTWEHLLYGKKKTCREFYLDIVDSILSCVRSFDNTQCLQLTILHTARDKGAVLPPNQQTGLPLPPRGLFCSLRVLMSLWPVVLHWTERLKVAISFSTLLWTFIWKKNMCTCILQPAHLF